MNNDTIRFSSVLNDHSEEICDIHNKEMPVVAISIDGYKTADDDEEGSVIAKVFGMKIDNEIRIFIEYHSVEAQVDTLAQYSIKEAIERIPLLLN